MYRDAEGRHIVREYCEDFFHLDGQLYYFIRFTDLESNEILLDREGRIPVFADKDSMVVYAALHGLSVTTYKWRLVEGHHDLDLLATWLAQPQETMTASTCRHCFSAWQMFRAVSAARQSRDLQGEDAANDDLYDRLIACMRNETVWSAAEIERLKAVLRAGLVQFRSLIKEYGAA